MMCKRIQISGLALMSLHAGQCYGDTTASSAASCPTALVPSGYAPPVVAAGYSAQLIANGLKSPRGIIFDQAGALLVVQQGTGILHMTFNDNGGTCLIVNKTTTLVSSSALNHGIELSADGKTLYASSSEAVYAWAYDAAAASVGTTNTTLVQNMSNSDHSTRTLLLSRKVPELLLVSRGSASNIDDLALQLDSGHAQLRAFNLSTVPTNRPYDYPSEGMLLGWGLRNSVGMAEEPLLGGIYTVENSADDIERLGTDVHTDDPGEEMNFHGYLNETRGNYGYPSCFAVWGTDLPDLGNLTVGSQFSLDPNSTLNDTTCASDYTPPRLTFQAHMAPLDIKFVPNGTAAYVTFHGSWDRTPPVGYKVSVLSFANGAPAEPPTSTTAAVDIFSNANLTACPGGCFRPVGLALDGQGRIFVSSDATGEIYVLQNEGAAPGSGGTATTSGASGTLVTSTAAATSSSGSSSSGATVAWQWWADGYLVAGVVVGMSVLGWMVVGA